MKNYKCQHWVCINANETNTAGRAEATWDMLTWYKQYLFLQFSLMKLHLCVLSGWNLGLQLLQVVQKNTITIATTMHIMAFTDFCYNKQVKSTAISQFIGRILQRTWPLRSSWAEFGQLLSCRCDVIGLQMRPQKDEWDIPNISPIPNFFSKSMWQIKLWCLLHKKENQEF